MNKQTITLKEFKVALKTLPLFVWVCWEGADGDYFPMAKSAFLKTIGADTANDGAHGGRPDGTAVVASIREDGVYVN